MELVSFVNMCINRSSPLQMIAKFCVYRQRSFHATYSILKKIEVGLWYNLAFFMSVCNSLKLLGNGSVTMFPWEGIHSQQWKNFWMLHFLCGLSFIKEK
jgi:hypothetical protein